MGKMTDFFQIVTPSTPTSVVQDNQLMDTGYAATSNYTWYQKLIQGSGTRLTRYNEYDVMDNDVEVSRALDIIAEEMTGRNTKTSLPIELKILDEKHANTEDTIVLTLRTACQHWCKIHGFDANRLFKLSRNMVKYGDCFFRKTSNFKKWEWIPAGAVSGAIVDSRDVTQVIGYRVRIGTKAAPGAGSINSLYRPTSDTGQYENVSIDDMVVFSINDDMSDAAPFGESVLRTVYKTHKQKELLEDAIVIYRIQRAPERRVFYIDVGKMPPHRVKSYLETIKNEIRQKKIPSNNMNGQNSVDAIYNPQCLALDTLIPILDGRTLTLAEIIEEHKKGLDLWTYSINPDTGAAVPGVISWAGVTRKNTEVLRITFDNGKTLICTPDHKIPVQGKGFVEAKDLTIDDSLFPYNVRQEVIKNSKNKYDYTQIYDTATSKWVYVHKMVSSFMGNEIGELNFDLRYADKSKHTVHHKNYNRFDNSPSNLVWMNSQDHILYHSVGGNNKTFKEAGAKHRELVKSDAEYRYRFIQNCKNAWSIRKEQDPNYRETLVARLQGHQQPFNNQKIIFDDYCFDRCVSLLQSNLLMSRNEFLDKLSSDDEFTNYYREINKPVDGTICKISSTINRLVLHNFLKRYGYNGFRDFRDKLINDKVQRFVHANSDFDLIKKIISLTSAFPSSICAGLAKHEQLNVEFCNWYNSKVRGLRNISAPGSRVLNQTAEFFGFGGWNNMVESIVNKNHRIVSIEYLTEPMDVGTLTIDQEEKYHNYHTFAIDAGIYVKNSMMEDIFLAQRSDGVGSKVDVLQGGAQLGEQSDLDYFCDKVLCGLRIPKGWMGRHREDSGAVFNDGKLGAAYIEEQQFAKFVERLQVYVSAVLDYEFKLFLYSSNIQIDNTIFEISLPKPSNYEKYKQADLDSALLGTIGTADGIPWLSKRWIARNYLQMSEEQLIDNENLLKQEKGIDSKYKTLQAIYGPPTEDGGMGGMGGGLGGLGGGIGGIEGGMGDDTFNIGGAGEGEGEGDFGELENPGEAPTPPVPSPTSPKQAPAPGATPKPV